MKKHLSTIANSLLESCAECLGISVDDLVEEFDHSLEPEVGNYDKKLVEFCSSRALNRLCQNNIGDKISNGSFGRFTFDMMVAWEMPSSCDDEKTLPECIAKEKEDAIGPPIKVAEPQVDDDIPLFYSDIMPLLVDEDRGIGEDAFLWLGSLLPLVVNVVNARFTFEALATHTASRLYFPAYDRFLKEIVRCIQYLQKQTTPTGIELADGEFILHVEGTARTHRVIRHIGGTSWPGRLTLTNEALYFEASGVVSYEDAIKIELSKSNVDHQVKSVATGPWGAPLFDKAMAYESSEPLHDEPIIFEFPELTSSTRRAHWLAIIKEVILLHRFLSKFDIVSTSNAWEIQARTILGIIRLHAAREMLRISSPDPRSFLIFALYDELPKGDYVLEELYNSLEQINEVHPCSAASVLKAFDMSHPLTPDHEVEEGYEVQSSMQPKNLESLETIISQAREESKEIVKANATVEGIKDESVAYNLVVLLELLIRSFKDVLPWVTAVLRWEKPVVTLLVLAAALVITYKEWVGYSFAAFLLWCVGMMQWARRRNVHEKWIDIVVISTVNPEQTTMESIVSAHRSLRNMCSMVRMANIAILKIQSILVSRAPKHADQVMMAMIGAAAFLAAVPFKYVIMAMVVYFFVVDCPVNWRTSSRFRSSDGVDRRLKEWWNSIPVTPVRIVNDGT